jgi:hypothetical protein
MTTATKLFQVDITYSVMVAANDERHAEILAETDLREIVFEEPSDIMCTGQVTKVSGPYRGSLPWGDNPDELPCEHFTGEA